MGRYKTDSLFVEVDSRFCGNDKGVVCNYPRGVLVSGGFF